MNSDTTVTVGLVIALIGSIIGIWGFFQNYKKSVKEEDKGLEDLKLCINSMNESILKLNFKTDQICTNTNETRTDLKSMKNDIEAIREKQIRHDIEIENLKNHVFGKEDD